MNRLAQVNIGATFQSPFGTGKTVGDLISTVLNVSFAVAGVIILFMFVYAGFMMIQSAGGGKSDSAEKAKQAATSALVGFAIIFVAYWLVRLIEIITTGSVAPGFITNPGF